MQDHTSPPSARRGPDRALDAHRVEVIVPLQSAFLSTLRTMTAALAADAGFSIDEIDDVRLALGEVVTAYLDAGSGTEGDGDAGNDRAHATFLVGDASLTVTVRPEHGEARVEFDELASGILAAVVDDHRVGDDGVTLAKRAVEATSGTASPR
jgi:serine/threonine-protein kinase RsbW